MRTLSILTAIATLSVSCWCQQPNDNWQEKAREYVATKNWNAAMALVNTQLQQSPQDPYILGWRARLLLWSGQVNEAEREWKRVLALAPQDPDSWIGMSGVYLREGLERQALKAVDRAIELDPSRADLHIARANVLLALKDPAVAQLEFRRAGALDPGNAEAKAGILSLHTTPKHQLLLGSETDLFSFAGAYQQNDVMLLSQWSAHWKTTVGGASYERGGFQASKVDFSLTRISPFWGSLTAGATAAHDYGIIPRNEAFYEYDRGWKLSGAQVVRGLELIYRQHWYWYSTARILALTEGTVLYLPRGWTWTLALTGAKSDFGELQTQWSPSGISRLGFPIIGGERHHLEGNAFFASGTEDFAQVDQIGRFSSRTYGGGLRLTLTSAQDVTSFASCQIRSSNQRETSLGVTYGVRF